MTLGEFIKKRKEELKLRWKDFEDAGISSQTISCIINNKQKSIMPATREKLATVLKCSQGEIQACMAEVPNPLRAEAEKPEGNAGISITAGAGKYKKKVTPAPDPKDEEPAEVFQLDESNVDIMFPEEPEKEAKEDEEQAEYTLSEVKTFEQMALNDYKQHLRELAWRIFLSGVPGTHTMENIYADIGYALVQELGIKNKDGDEE